MFCLSKRCWWTSRLLRFWFGFFFFPLNHAIIKISVNLSSCWAIICRCPTSLIVVFSCFQSRLYAFTLRPAEHENFILKLPVLCILTKTGYAVFDYYYPYFCQSWDRITSEGGFNLNSVLKWGWSYFQTFEDHLFFSESSFKAFSGWFVVFLYLTCSGSSLFSQRIKDMNPWHFSCKSIKVCGF